MTNYEKIKGMSVEELAEFLLVWEYVDEIWIASDGSEFDSFDKETAISHEIKWLESECDAE